MSIGFRLTLIWLAGGTLALMLALIWLPSVHYEGEILPTGHDSFYHARRILDAAAARSQVLQFDTRIHAPEGSWVPWPWGYDYGMAWIARIAGALNNTSELLSFLVYVPPIGAFVTAGLILGIAGLIGLSVPLRLVAILCFAVSPLTQNLHGVGRIDHHWFEYTVVLGALLAGLWWLQRAGSSVRAALVGMVLGLACAIHNGLFLLQIPLVLSIAVLWIKGIRLQERALLAVACTLVFATVLAVIPSEPFQRGYFSYDLLSWFHLYVAISSGLLLLLLRRFPPTPKAGVGLALVTVLLLVPVAPELYSGLGFLQVELVELSKMPEARSPLGVSGDARAMGLMQAASAYSGLVWLLPAVMGGNVVAAFRSKHPASLFFHVFSLFGATLLLQQYRFHHFGSFALYLPILLLAQRWITAGRVRVTWTILIPLLVFTYLPCRKPLQLVPVPGFSYDYVVTRSAYPVLAKACKTQPGIVLASHNDGHYIRYHTECSVIANNLILSQQSRDKVNEIRSLFARTGAELQIVAPWIRYVLAARDDDIFDQTITPAEVHRLNAGLRNELLFNEDNIPERFRMLHEVALELENGTALTVARVFRIEP